MRLHMACLITLGCAHVRPVRTGAVPAFLKQYLPSLGMRRHQSSAAGCMTRVSSQETACAAKPWSAEVPDDRIRVFLVRHGAVDLTTPGMTFPKDCFYGGHNVPLSAYGEAEARAAAEVLADEKLDMVYASPLSRAAYGAERVAERHNLKVVLDERFKEVQRGRWLGMTKEQIDAQFPGDLKNFAQDPTWNGHGGETYRDLSARVLAGFETMLGAARAANASKIALVSHMWVTKSIVTHAMNILPDQQDKWASVSIPTASISVLDFATRANGGAPKVVNIGFKPPLTEQDAMQHLDPHGKPWGG